MYQRILLMDDGSELSRRAVPHAAAFAALANAGVLVLRVSHAAGAEPRALTSDAWDAFFASPGSVPGSEEHLEADPPLTEVTSALRAAGIARVAHLVVHADEEGTAILAVAQSLRCDLIVMSTHGLSGLRRSVLGSVADHVVRHANGIPVLLCR